MMARAPMKASNRMALLRPTFSARNATAKAAAGKPGARPGLSPRAGKRPGAEAGDHHVAGHVIAVDVAVECERQRHRVGDGDGPAGVVAVRSEEPTSELQ